MRRAARLAAALIALAAAPLAAKDSLGVYDRWGAFRDASPLRCYAISAPVQAPGGGSWRPFAAIGTWPGQGARGQVHIRLSHDRDPRARVTLSVGDRRFDLVAGNADAWAPDARTDAAIIAAMRNGTSMRIAWVSKDGRDRSDGYLLAGVATAIDAAALGCARR